MPRSYFTDFERDDETTVTVEYTISPFDPGNTYGPPENCYPPEGGEVEILKVFNEAGPVKTTDAEDEKWCSWIAENHDHDGDYYDDFD